LLVVGFLVGDAERGRTVGDAVCTRVGRPVVGCNEVGCAVVGSNVLGACDAGPCVVDGAAVGLVGELVIGLCVGAAVVGFFDVDGVAKDCGRDVGMDDG